MMSTKNSIYKKNIGTFPKWKSKSKKATNESDLFRKFKK